MYREETLLIKCVGFNFFLKFRKKKLKKKLKKLPMDRDTFFSLTKIT